jgi:hypothetical protein
MLILTMTRSKKFQNVNSEWCDMLAKMLEKLGNPPVVTKTDAGRNIGKRQNISRCEDILQTPALCRYFGK